MLGKSRLGPLLPSLLLLRDKSKHHLLQAVSVERGRLCTLQGWLLRLAVVVKVSKNVEFKASQALVKLISYQVLTVRSWAFNWPLFKTEIGQARWRPPTGCTEGRINTGIMVADPQSSPQSHTAQSSPLCLWCVPSLCPSAGDQEIITEMLRHFWALSSGCLWMVRIMDILYFLLVNLHSS